MFDVCEPFIVSLRPQSVGTTRINPVVSGTGLANFAITQVAGAYTIAQATSTTVVTCLPGAPYNGWGRRPARWQ